MVPNAGIDNVETQPMFIPEAPIDLGSKEISIIAYDAKARLHFHFDFTSGRLQE